MYDAQVQDAYYGYSLIVSSKGVTLRRSRYGQTGISTFKSVKDWADAEEGRLRIEVHGCRVTIFEEDEAEPLLSYEDPVPFTHGIYGFFSSGGELRVHELHVRPLK